MLMLGEGCSILATCRANATSYQQDKTYYNAGPELAFDGDTETSSKNLGGFIRSVYSTTICPVELTVINGKWDSNTYWLDGAKLYILDGKKQSLVLGLLLGLCSLVIRLMSLYLQHQKIFQKEGNMSVGPSTSPDMVTWRKPNMLLRTDVAETVVRCLRCG